MTADETLIDLLRHGEPLGGRKYRGQTDDPLTERGWQQMWQATGSDRPWRRIITSPLARCGAFADTLGEAMGIAPERDNRLMEVGYGHWSGKTPDELSAEAPEGFEAFRRDPWSNRPADAEPMGDFTKRVIEAYHDHRDAADGDPLLIVAHAGVIRTIIAHNLGMPLEHMYQLQLPYAGRARFRCRAGWPRLVHMAPTPPEL